MKTFKTFVLEQNIEEGKVGDRLIKSALVGSALFAGGAYLHHHGYLGGGETPTQQVQIAPQQPQQAKTKQEKPQAYQFEHDSERRLYGALVSAEQRGNVGDDPTAYDVRHYIRTKIPTKSSSYGPLQINSSVNGLLDPKNEYHRQFMAQQKKFLSSPLKHKTYGAGGAGDLSGEENHAKYQELAVHVMRGKAKELGIDISKQLSQKDFNRFVEYWRGQKIGRAHV